MTSRLNFIFFALPLLILTSAKVFPQTIRTMPYFILQENKVEHFRGIYSFRQKAPNLKSKDPIISPPPPSLPHKDTMVDETEIIYKTINISGHKAYYSINTSDTSSVNPIIGNNHLLFSVLIFEKGTVLLATVLTKADLFKLKFSDFRYRIPSIIKPGDTIVTLIYRNLKVLWCDFKITNLSLNGRIFYDCLQFKAIEISDEGIETGMVWLSKQYGLLKWVNYTGKIETREL